MKVLLLSKYADMGPSSRVRSYQYIPYLKREGIDVTVAPLFSNRYVKDLYNKRTILPLSIFAYFKRVKSLLSLNKFDIVWLEKEVYPWLPYLDELILSKIKVPYIVDYDDAIFHRYDQHQNKIVRSILQNKIPRIMKNACTVIVGNKYLYEKAYASGANKVIILPSVIDLDRYLIDEKRSNDYFTIGWIGSPVTAKYLNILDGVFKHLKDKNNIKLMIIGAKDIEIKDIDIVYHQWDIKTEVELLKQCNTGIMPLTDNLWEKGKCGYKLIQYMACSMPVIASPVGANLEIVENDINGYLANTTADWLERLAYLIEERDVAKKLGYAGRKKVERLYNLQVTAPILAKIMREI